MASNTAARIERLQMVDRRIEAVRNELAQLLASRENSVMSDTLHSGYFRSPNLSSATSEAEEERMVRALGSTDNADDDSRPPTRK